MLQKACTYFCSILNEKKKVASEAIICTLRNNYQRINKTSRLINQNITTAEC